MPSSTASRKLTEQRWPVTFTPRLCASLIVARQLGAPDIGVGLDPGGALRGPVRDETPRRLGRVHHGHAAATLGPREVRCRQMDAGTGHRAPVDVLPEIDLGVGRPAAGGADGGDARTRGRASVRCRTSAPRARRPRCRTGGRASPRSRGSACDRRDPSPARPPAAAPRRRGRPRRSCRPGSRPSARRAACRRSHRSAARSSARRRRCPRRRTRRTSSDSESGRCAASVPVDAGIASVSSDGCSGAWFSLMDGDRYSTSNRVIMSAERCSAMWQCSIQRPGLDGSSRISTTEPAGSNTVSFQTGCSSGTPFTDRAPGTAARAGGSGAASRGSSAAR